MSKHIDSLATRVTLHPFLAGLDKRELSYLTDCAMAVHFKPGELILQAGQYANRFYLIETGNVAVEALDAAGDIVRIESVGAGELLGWSWMFPPYMWHFTARAVTPTTAIFFYGSILREYCERDPALGYELFKRMSAVMVKRLQRAREKLVQLHASAVH